MISETGLLSRQFSARLSVGRWFVAARALAVAAVALCAVAASAQAQRVTPILGERGVPQRVLVGAIAGSVVDSAARPLAGARIGIQGVEVTVETGEEGRFRFAEVPPGRYVLTVERSGYTRDSLSVIVAPRDTATVTIRLVQTDTTVQSRSRSPLAGSYAVRQRRD